jgi:hypothetical protein
MAASTNVHHFETERVKTRASSSSSVNFKLLMFPGTASRETSPVDGQALNRCEEDAVDPIWDY